MRVAIIKVNGTRRVSVDLGDVQYRFVVRSSREAMIQIKYIIAVHCLCQ